MANKATPKPERRDVRRTILESARKRFLLDSFRKTTIESIAADQHVSKKSIYALFASKQAIWDELVRIEAKKTVEYLKTHLPAELPPLARLEKLVSFYLRRRLQANAEARERNLVSSLIGSLAPEPPEETSKLLREAALQQAFPMLVEELIREHQTGVAQTSGSANESVVQVSSPAFDSALLTSMVVGAVISASNYSAMSTDFVNEVCSVVRKMVQHG